MRALVTGGGGFLGRWIVEKLLDRGDKVRVLGRRDYPDLKARGVETVKADLADRERVVQACAGMDAVFHVAALTGIWGPRSDYYNTNVKGTENVLAGCWKQGVTRLVYTSTPSVVYGREPIRGGDETLPYPDKFMAVYPETKAQAESAILQANGEEGLCTCALRPHLIWGPGDTNLIPRLVARAHSGKLARVGDRKNRVGVIYVENAADAHLLACDRLEPGSPVVGQAYFLTEPEPVNCWEFIESLLAGLGCPPLQKTVSLKTAYRVGAAFEFFYRLFRIRSEPAMTRFLALQLATDHWFDISRARQDLGWTSKVTLEAGMKKLFQDFKSHSPGG